MSNTQFCDSNFHPFVIHNMGFQINITSMMCKIGNQINVSKLEWLYCLVTHTLYSCTSINTNCLQTQVWISLNHQDVKIVAPGLRCDQHFVLVHKYQDKLYTNPSLDLYVVSGMTNVQFHTLPLVLDIPGGTIGYPAHPRLIRCLSVILSVIHF